MTRPSPRRRPMFALIAALALSAPAGAALVVPEYNSLPGAHAKLFLDFDGIAYPGNWGSYTPGTVPAYDIDNNPTSFSTTEFARIREIFLRVAEKYSPFNINVTTVDPGNGNNRETARVVIGGNGAWYGSAVGGVAFVNSFSNASPNTSWVFPANLGNGNAKNVAEAAAHEAGHMFGLSHQAAYNAEGERTQDYSTNGNSPHRRPVMGSSYGSTRGLWWSGTTTSATRIQNDLDVLSNSTNGFGYRTDDHGGTPETATALITSESNTVSAYGIIERNDDADLFSFTTGSGTVSFTLAVADFGAMLDATLRLFTGEGALLRTINSATLGESFTHALTAGEYLIGVSGAGNYGDLGQYWLTGQVVPVPEPMAIAGGVALFMVLRRRRGPAQ